MPVPFIQTPMLGGTYELDDGFRVRLRMARSSDLRPIRALSDSAGVELAPLIQFDPRRRCVICATALIDSTERLVGVGAIDLDGDRRATPDTLLVGDEHAEQIAELLVGALLARAAFAAEARAA
jgi:hypothetical protein